jgi:hypothetical protein
MRRSPVSRSEATAAGGREGGSFFRSNRVRARKEGDCRLRSRRVVRATPFKAAANESSTRIEDLLQKKGTQSARLNPKAIVAMMMIVGRTSFSFSFSLGRKVLLLLLYVLGARE